jgi:hypothetical protein
MTVRREIARKHVPREAYLARDDTDTHILSCASRFTRKSSRSAIAAETFMNHAG